MSGESLPIVPEDTFSKKEGYPGLRSTLNLPGFCQFSYKVLKISIILNQSVEDKGVDFTGCRILSKNGIKKGGIADRTDDQLVDPLRRSGADEDNIDPQEDEKKDGRDEEKGLDFQGVFPFIKELSKHYRG
jgi:hypothetical protein